MKAYLTQRILVRQMLRNFIKRVYNRYADGRHLITTI